VFNFDFCFLIFDLIIIGGSVAATSAGIYAVRRNLNFKIISKDSGGEVATSGEIGNYPGISNIDGIELSEKFQNHLNHYGVKVETGIEVEKIIKQDDGNFCIKVRKVKPTAMAGLKVQEKEDDNAVKCDYTAKAVILATGVHPKPLNVPGDKEYRNKGVSYCTTCDGPLFKDRTTATIGGGNSALESSLMMAEIAKKHYVINIEDHFTGDQILYDKLKKKENIEIIFNAQTTEIFGDNFVKGIKYFDKKEKEIKEIKVDGIFIHIGVIPNSNIVPEGINKNDFGEIIVNKKCETNMPGFFAAGDVTDISYKQIVIAAGQGAVAALAAVEYLNKRKK